MVAWRLDSWPHRGTWDSGEGARRFGGRWNSAGTKAVYCSVDPAAAILEVAVHKGFKTLDTMPHVLSSARILDLSTVHIVEPQHVPNSNWLRPGTPGAGQQSFGDALLAAHAFVLIPSAVSVHSWNLLFSPETATNSYRLLSQEAFALDTRLHPATP